MGAASAAAGGAAGPPGSEVAGVRASRLRPSPGASRSSSRSRLDLGAAGAAAATFPADFPVAPGDGLTGGGLDVPFAAAGRFVVSSSSELDADSELLSLSCRRITVQLNSTVQDS
jgi:hypothetical protein